MQTDTMSTEIAIATMVATRKVLRLTGALRVSPRVFFSSSPADDAAALMMATTMTAAGATSESSSALAHPAGVDRSVPPEIALTRSTIDCGRLRNTSRRGGQSTPSTAPIASM